MKITVKKGDLDATVQVAAIAIGGGSDDAEIAGHFLFRYRGGLLEVLGSNGGRLVAGGPVAGALVEDGTEGQAFTAPAWRVREWLSAVGKDDEEIKLIHENGVTKAVSKRGSGKFGSLDPKNFPVIDNTLRDATEVGTVESARLTRILSYARQFVSDQETRHPPLVAVENRNGVLHSTDSVGVVMIKSPILEKSTLRVHGKDVSPLLSFLAFKGSEEVKLMEHDLCLIAQRGDKHFIAVGRWMHEFPMLKIDRDAAPKCKFSLPTEDLVGAIKYLGAFAKKDDTHLHFRFEDGNIVLSMESASGDEEQAEQPIACIDPEGMDQLLADGYKEFILSKRFVGYIAAAAADGVPLQFGVNWVKSNGYVTVKREDSGDEYFTLIVWIRKK